MPKSSFHCAKQTHSPCQSRSFFTHLSEVDDWLLDQNRSPWKSVTVFPSGSKNLMDILNWFFKKKITMISFTLLRFYAFKLVFLVTLTSHVFFTRYMKIVRFIVEEYFQTWDKILTGLPNWVLSHNCQTAWNSRLKGKKSSHFFRNLWRGTFNPISLVPMLLKMWLFRLMLYPFDNLQFTSQ